MPRPVKGERTPGSGRAPGTPNKTTRIMRELWLEAFERAGGVDYLVQQATENPSSFMQGLLRQIPNEVAAKAEGVLEVRHRIHIGPKPAESEPPSYAMWPGDESGE